MLNKIFNKEKKYIFIINNFFQLIYFIFIIKEYNIKHYLFLIPNYKNYLNNYLFLLENINYKIINNIYIRGFPFSIIDSIKYRKTIINILPNNYIKYNIIATTSNNILNKIFLWIFNKNKIFLLNTTPDSLTKKKITFYDLFFDIINRNKNNYIYKLNFLDLNWEYFFTKHKENINTTSIIEKIKIDIDKNIAIFLWQNHNEIWLTDKEYLKILETLKNKYENKNIIFYIKPHPLDNFKYLGFELINKQIPWELLNFILNNKKTYLLTFFSSTILTLRANNKKIIKYQKQYTPIQQILINKITKWV